MKTAMKKTYKTPELKAINIVSAEVLLEASTLGDITDQGYDPTEDDNYDLLLGYDENEGGWGIGFPD